MVIGHLRQGTMPDAPFHWAIEDVGAITSQPVLGGLHHQYAESDFRHTQPMLSAFDVDGSISNESASSCDAYMTSKTPKAPPARLVRNEAPDNLHPGLSIASPAIAAATARSWEHSQEAALRPRMRSDNGMWEAARFTLIQTSSAEPAGQMTSATVALLKHFLQIRSFNPARAGVTLTQLRGGPYRYPMEFGIRGQRRRIL